MGLKKDSKDTANVPQVLIIVERKACDEAITASAIAMSFLNCEGIEVREDVEKSMVWSQDWYFYMDASTLGTHENYIRVCGRNLKVCECPMVNVMAVAGAKLDVPSAADLIRTIDSNEGRIVALCEAGASGNETLSAQFYCSPMDQSFLLELQSFRCRGTTVTISPVVGGSTFAPKTRVLVRAQDGGLVLSAKQISDALLASEGVAVELLAADSEATIAGEAIFFCGSQDVAKLSNVPRVTAAKRSFSLLVMTQAPPAPSPASPSPAPPSPAPRSPAPPSPVPNVSRKLAPFPDAVDVAEVNPLPEDVTYHVKIFHDAENCFCRQGLGIKAHLLKERILSEVLSAYIGNAEQASRINLSHVRFEWNFVLHYNPANSFHPDESFLNGLTALTANIIDPRKKGDAVDNKIKDMITLYIDDVKQRIRPGDKMNKYVCVLISGDKDFASEVKSLGHNRLDVILLCNKNVSPDFLNSIYPPRFRLDIWEEIIEASRNPRVGAIPPADVSPRAGAPPADVSPRIHRAPVNVIQRLVAHITDCGNAIEASQLSAFYHQNLRNRAELEAAGKAKNACANSDGELVWQDCKAEGVGFGFIIATELNRAVVPMVKATYHFLFKHYRSMIEQDVEQLATGCTVAFVSRRNGACNICLTHPDVTALNSAKSYVIDAIEKVCSMNLQLSGIGAAELQANTELELLKDAQKVSVSFPVVVSPAPAGAGSASAVVHELRVAVAKRMLNPPKGVPATSHNVVLTAKRYVATFFRQNVGITLELDRFTETSSKGTVVNLKVVVPDAATKMRVLGMRVPDDSLKFSDFRPPIVLGSSTELEKTNCTILYRANCGAGAKKVEEFLQSLCKVLETVNVEGFHRCLFVKDTWSYLEKRITADINGVELSLISQEYEAKICLLGTASSVAVAKSICEEQQNQLLQVKCVLTTSVSSNNEHFEQAFRREMSPYVNKTQTHSVRYYFDRKRNTDPVAAIKVFAYPQDHAQWTHCKQIASDWSASCKTEKIRHRDINNLDIMTLRKDLGLFLIKPEAVGMSPSKRPIELPMLELVGLEDRVDEGKAHIHQLLGGFKPITRHIAYDGPDKRYVAKYFALHVVRPVINKLRAAIKKSNPAVSVSECNDNSDNILILHAKAAEMEAAIAMAHNLLRQHVQGLTKHCMSTLLPREVRWLQENRPKVADDLSVIVDMEDGSSGIDQAIAGPSAPIGPSTTPFGASQHSNVKATFRLDDIQVLVANCDFMLLAKELNCDCLVNSANSSLSNGLGIARAISKEGGAEFERACRALIADSTSNRIPIGSAATTPAFGNLFAVGFKHVVHLVSPRLVPSSTGGVATASSRDHELMRSAVRCALSAAAAAGAVCVAIPGIGTGVYMWSVQESTSLVAEAASEWVAANPRSSIREIIFFDLSEEVVEGYADALTALKEDSNKFSVPLTSPIVPVSPRVPPVAPVLPTEQICWQVQPWELTDAMKPFIVQRDNDRWMPYDIDQLDQLLLARQLGHDKCTLTGDLAGVKNNMQYVVHLYRLTQTNTATGYTRGVMFMPMDVQKPPPLYAERISAYQQQLATFTAPAPSAVRHPRASCSNGALFSPSSPPTFMASPSADVGESAVPSICLFGDADAVTAAEAAILAALASNKKRDLVSLARLISATKVSFAQAITGVRDLFSNDSDVEIVATDETTSTVTLEALGISTLSQATSALMTHIADQTCDYHKVKYPETWTSAARNATSHAPELVELDRTTDEYVMASQVFLNNFSADIVKIERVENPTLYDFFYKKKREIAELNDGDDNVQLLKHGTKNTDPKAIWSSGSTNMYGFDHRFSYLSTYDQMYGKGNYFAEDTAYAHDYSHKLANGDRQIFLASVAMGRVDQKKSPFREEYRRTISAAAGCQCVRGVIRDPYQGIITYELHQTYPTYLVTYRKQ